MFARVIIDLKHEDINQAFDYKVPEVYQDFLVRGMRVIVPFGHQNRLGFVLEVIDHSLEATKDILEVLDALPMIDDELFELMDYLALLAPTLLSALFHLIVPNELFIAYQKEAKILNKEALPEELLSYFNKNGIWKLKKKDQIFYPQLKRLQDKKIIKIETTLKEKEQDKLNIAYQYNSQHHYHRINLYQDVIDFIHEKDHIFRKDLIEKGVSQSKIQTLVKHEVLMPIQKEVFRAITHHFDLKDKIIILNNEQNNAYQMMTNHLNTQKTFLLKGVTGSGKTEIYLALMEDVLNLGQQILFLVPEIQLIGPTAQRIKSRFEHVAIYHSGLSKGERFDQYQLVLNHKANIVIGTRSACFLPMERLGLIIVDEEHDSSYQQQEGIIYDAREIVLLRSKYHQIPLVLGSATPSIISMYRGENKRYQLVELNNRPNDIQMPKIHFIDMKDELNHNHTSIFSRILLDKMKDRLAKKEQIILLFNRKGYAPFVLCRNCGDVPKCPHCDVSLTYYKDKSYMKCHYCGYEKTFNQTCDLCHEPKVKEIGVGIEFVEQALKIALPDAKILRLDRNTTLTKGSHELIWSQFLNEEADILLGTQMIAKGLDFPKVTLVGVIMADLLSKIPAYNANEQAYMLLAQVTGRSGRFLPGEAIIQSYDLKHLSIDSLKNDYMSFYKEALYQRKMLNYPPFKNVSQILFEGKSFLQTYQHAYLIKKKLSLMNLDVLGPSQAIIKKMRDLHRFTITIKYDTIEIIKVFELLKSFDNEAIKVRYFPTLDLV